MFFVLCMASRHKEVEQVACSVCGSAKAYLGKKLPAAVCQC